MKKVKIRQATASDIPAMNELFRKDLGYAECTLEIVEKQFTGLDNSREAVFVAEAEEWARKNGACSMRLNSGESRKQAHEFYCAQGYTDDKKQLRFIKEL